MVQRFTAWPSPQGMWPQSDGHLTGGGVVGLAVGFGLGDTLSDLLVSVRCRLRGANPPGLDRSNGLVTPASLLFAPAIFHHALTFNLPPIRQHGIFCNISRKFSAIFFPRRQFILYK